MNLKDLIFGGGVKSGDDGGTYRDSIQAWLPIKNIIGGVVITKDGRFVKILELLPVNIYLKSPNDRQNIISSFAAYLKIAPNDLQMVARTLPADTQAYDAVNESSSLQIKYEVGKMLRSFISLSKYDLISCAKEWRANKKSFQSALDYIYLSKDIIIKQDVLIS